MLGASITLIVSDSREKSNPGKIRRDATGPNQLEEQK